MGNGVLVGGIAVGVVTIVGVAVCCVTVIAGVVVLVAVAVGEAVEVGGISTSWVGFKVEVGIGTLLAVGVGVPFG